MSRERERDKQTKVTVEDTYKPSIITGLSKITQDFSPFGA